MPNLAVAVAFAQLKPIQRTGSARRGCPSGPGEVPEEDTLLPIKKPIQ